MLKDTFGRTIDYIRISLTDRCNYKCRYCMPEHGIVKLPREDILTYSELFRLINILQNIGIKKFRFTGGEPFVRNKSLEFFENLKLKNFSITTNLAAPNLDIDRINKLSLKSINVSCDSLKPQRYEYVTRGGNLDLFLENLKQLKINDVKLNVVLIKNFNEDEIYDFIQFSIDNNLTLRFIEKMDIIQDELKFISLESLKDRLLNEGIITDNSFKINNSVADYYKLAGHPSKKIGFITPISKPFCSSCNKIRIKANGEIKLCIYSNYTYSVRDQLRANTDDSAIMDWLKTIIKFKPFSSYNANTRNEVMSKIGG